MTGSVSAHETTERIREASDIVDVVSAYVTLRRAGRNLKGLCPFHVEKTPSFNVMPQRQTFKCFGCGVGGDVFKFIQLRENVEFLEARALLAARAGISIDAVRKSGSASEFNKLDLERVNRWAAAWFAEQLKSPGGEMARAYIASRGIAADSVARFGLGFAPAGWEGLCSAARAQKVAPELLLAAGLARPRETGGHYDAFRDRLMFPIYDVMNRVVGFGGRALGDDPAKYINSPQNLLFDKSRCLFGLATAKDAFSAQGEAILVEGYIDCLMAQQFGFANTVATLGTALTSEHIRLLRRYVERVVLVFDADEAGRRATDAAIPLILNEQMEVRLTQVPEGKDPADYLLAAGSQAFKQVLTSSVGALESKWKQVLRQYAGDATVLGRRKAVEEFLGLVGRGADLGTLDPIQRGLVLNQVGKLLGISTEEVNRQLRITGRKQSAPAGSQSAAAREARGPRPITTPPASAADAAMRELLEVVLAEPKCYAGVVKVFEPDWLEDETLRAVARAVVELGEQAKGPSIVQLLARFESVETASLILALQQAGERRENYERTIEGALDCLRREREHRHCEEIGRKMRTESQPTLSELAARRRNHFAGLKHLATPLAAGAGPTVPSETH